MSHKPKNMGKQVYNHNKLGMKTLVSTTQLDY